MDKVRDHRFERCGDSLRRLDEDPRLVDRLVAIARDGMASGVDETFDIDAFVQEVKQGCLLKH